MVRSKPVLERADEVWKRGEVAQYEGGLMNKYEKEGKVIQLSVCR